MTDEWIHLGTANGWKDDPPEWVKHQEQCEGSDETRKNLGTCYNAYRCNKCKITWSVDSSG